MTGNAGGAKALYYVAGIIALAVVFYWIISELNEVSEKVDNLADRLTRPKTKPEDMAPIDVASETVAPSPTESAIVTQASPVNVTESNHSEQNGSKVIGKRVFTTCLDSQNDSDHCAESLPEWTHTEDFHTVKAHGKTFNLTLYQARAFEKLWNAGKNRVPELHQAAILEGIESCSKRLRDIFKSNMAAYRGLITRGERKGTFRLRFS
jgi:hypothetical protein